MAISTNGAIITRVTSALYGEYLSNASYTEIKDTAPATVAANFLTNDFAGKTDLQVATTISGQFSVRLQALRYKEPGRANLASITWDELNKLLGASATEMLKSFGATELGTAEQILNVSNKTKNQLAMIYPNDCSEAAFAAYALTRVLPLMKNYGIAQVSAI